MHRYLNNGCLISIQFAENVAVFECLYITVFFSERIVEIKNFFVVLQHIGFIQIFYCSAVNFKIGLGFPEVFKEFISGFIGNSAFVDHIPDNMFKTALYRKIICFFVYSSSFIGINVSVILF